MDIKGQNQKRVPAIRSGYSFVFLRVSRAKENRQKIETARNLKFKEMQRTLCKNKNLIEKNEMTCQFCMETEQKNNFSLIIQRRDQKLHSSYEVFCHNWVVEKSLFLIRENSILSVASPSVIQIRHP